MTVKALRLLALTTAVLGCINDAAADERKHPMFLIGGIAMPFQAGPSGESSEAYTKAPGGTSIGWMLGGGIRLARAVGFEADFSGTGWMKAREVSRYDMTFNEERRDRFVLFAARLYLHRLDAIGVEPVIGVAVTTTEAWSQTEQRNPLFPQQAPVVGPRRSVQLANSVGPLVGLDVRVGSGRVALVPSFCAIMSGMSYSFDEYPGGYPNLTYRFSLGARIDLLPH